MISQAVTEQQKKIEIDPIWTDERQPQIFAIYAWFPALRWRYSGAVLLLPSCRCWSLYIHFRCHFVNMRRNWIETTFHNDERQAAQTSILDQANML